MQIKHAYLVQQLSSGPVLERSQIGMPGIMEVAIQLPALRITNSFLSKNCADINSLVAMPLCVLSGVASQLQTADVSIIVMLTGFCLVNLVWREAKVLLKAA